MDLSIIEQLLRICHLILQ